jgi:hypothetical protein
MGAAGGTQAAAAADTGDPCLSAIPAAAARHGVPEDVLATVARIESGDPGSHAVPARAWAVGHRGQPLYAQTLAAAAAHADRILGTGDSNVDLGCFQINVRWHGRAFASARHMLDPAANADYAARLLAAHHDRLGSWDAAVGAYHSATPEVAAAYLARFHAARGLQGAELDAPAPLTVVERWPAAPGSLFAAPVGTRPLLGMRP